MKATGIVRRTDAFAIFSLGMFLFWTLRLDL